MTKNKIETNVHSEVRHYKQFQTFTVLKQEGKIPRNLLL